MTFPGRLVQTPRFHKQLLLARDPVRYFQEVAREFGDFVRVRGVLELYLLNHPDLVSYVLQNKSGDIHRQNKIYERLANVGRTGLASSDGPHWRKQRRTIAPLFTANAIRRFGESMIDSASRWVDRWSALGASGETFDMKEEMNALTLEINARCLFSVDVDARQQRELHAWFGDLKRYMEEFPYPLVSEWWFPSPLNLRTRASLRQFDAYTTALMEARRGDARRGEYQDLLSMMLDAADEANGARMTDDEIRHEMLTFFIAGFETASSSMSWAWYHLATNPEVEARLHAELDAVLAGRLPTMEDLPRLPYTRMLIDEVMRITPPAWFMGRSTATDIELWGARVPKGSILVVAMPALHNHPDFWPEPERFDPERFSPARSAGRPACAYVPFSRGEHACIGKFFATQEILISLAALASRYRAVIVPGGFDPALASGISMTPKHGLGVRLEPRPQSQRAAA